ncbi:hypothetical protein RJT34_27072 [Clitoria ternatea]|uniref:Uncharacterized protein n=1 Tax=Clitoria ternatea TaxID=43366 RepID=A0AAN9F7I1_CLITE
MKGTSKVIMGATLVMVVSLAVVLGLIIVLLAELYCSLLLRRRQLKKSNNIPISTPQTATTIATTSSTPSSHTPPHSPLPPPPFSNIYSQGVLQAPRSFLFPCKNDLVEAKNKQEPNASPHGIIGLVPLTITTTTTATPPSSSSLASFLARAPPQDTLEGGSEILCAHDHNKPCGAEQKSNLVMYISNPIYENEEGKTSGANTTPFETPHTSPSLLDRNGSSEEENHDDDGDGKKSPCCDANANSSSFTPPLTPMKKLPAEASSVSLRDATSLATSGSDSHSINGPSSSSSGSPCTSPSW